MSAQIKVATSPVEDLPRQIFPLRGHPLRVALVHDWLEVYAGAEKDHRLPIERLRLPKAHRG